MTVSVTSGPHHGHYVAIVKSRESWVVFDDDTVDVIKESDISKYFGDSNSGCAYVLYYQAVDMDLVALGLRAEETPAHGSVSELSPLQTPLLPPGLTHEGDSDASASEIAPKTPASPFQAPAAAPSTPPSLTVTIPASEGGSQSLPIAIPVPAATPPKSVQSPPPPSVSPNGRTGFFTLRNKASKPSIEATKLFNVAGSPPPPMPPPPSSSGTISNVGSPQVSASPSQASTVTDSISHLINGKVKSPKEKSTGWFKRSKSVKPENSRKTSIRRPGTASGTTDGSTSHTSSSTSLPNSSGHAQSSAVDISASASPSKTQVRPLPPVPVSNSPRSSSHQSSSPKSHTVLVPSSFPLAPSTSRASDHTAGKSPPNRSSAVLAPSSDFSPEAGPSTSKSTSPPPAFATAPRKRPSTAGSAHPRTHMNGLNGSVGKRELVARRSQESFVPPLPSDNTGYLPGAPAVRPRVGRASPSPSPSPARGSSPADERIRWRNSAASGSVNGHAINGNSNSSSSGDNGAGHTHAGATLSSAPVTPLVKRASRKLSFSGGMGGILGLGRKDKDKDKDSKDRGRERDRASEMERQRASVFSAASMSPPSIVPGLSSAGRY